MKNVPGFHFPLLIQLCASRFQIRVRYRVFKISVMINDVPGKVFPVRALHLPISRKPSYTVEEVIM